MSQRWARCLLGSNAEFVPDGQRSWRWVAEGTRPKTAVRFELLAGLADQPAPSTISFEACDHLGAANLRGTGVVAHDVEVRTLRARIGGVDHVVEVNVSGLAGFLLAKTVAAYSRRKPKDWYDIALVLLHDDEGGVAEAAGLVRKKFHAELVGSLRTALDAQIATVETRGSVDQRRRRGLHDGNRRPLDGGQLFVH